MNLWNDYINQVKNKYPAETAKVNEFKSEGKYFEARKLLQAVRDRDILMKGLTVRL